MWDDHGNRYDMMNGGGTMIGLWVLGLVLLIVVVVAVLANLYLHVRPGRGASAAPAVPAESEARRLLDRRLASGEITVEDYASLRTALES